MSAKEAAGRIASESSAGTWTTLHKLPERVARIKARAFHIEGKYVKVAYPLDLWEPGNAPQLLSGIAGNIFGMKALQNLKLIDASLPKKYIRSFKGPHHGIKGIRDLLKVKKRPVTGAVPKPKIGFSAAEHAKIAYETWMGYPCISWQSCPQGTRAGACATMQAIEATMDDIDLKEYAKDHKELQQALDKWEYFKPR